MSADINLLLNTNDESLKRKKTVKILSFVAVVSLMGIGIISLIIFLLIQVINPLSIKKEQDEILRKISQLQGRQAKLFIVNNRINNITEILKKRRDLPKIANMFLKKTPNKLSIGNLEIDDKVISLTAKSASLSVIGELINNLTDMVRQKEIASLTLNSLSFDESTNDYQVSIKGEL